MSKLRILISVILVSLFVVCGILYFNYINKEVKEETSYSDDYSDVTNVPIIDAKLGEDIKITQSYLKKYVLKKSSLWYMSNGIISSINTNDDGTIYKITNKDKNVSLNAFIGKSNNDLKKGDKVNFVGTINLSDGYINLSKISKNEINYSSPTIIELDELVNHIDAIKSNYFIVNGYMVTEGTIYKLYDNKEDYKEEEVQSIPFEIEWASTFNYTGNANVTLKCLIGSTYKLKDCTLEK